MNDANRGVGRGRLPMSCGAGRTQHWLAGPLAASWMLAACGGGSSNGWGNPDDSGAPNGSSGGQSSSGGSAASSGAGTSGGGSSSGGSGSSSGGSGSSGSGTSSGSRNRDAGTSRPGDGGSGAHDASRPFGDAASGSPSGWLYTQGSKIYVSNGGSGASWMGRGVNMDDVSLCGGSSGSGTAEQTLTTIVSGLMPWKPTFVRVSLAMHSGESWTSNPAQYQTPMTNVIRAIGSHAGVYVLVTLRSDASMTETDMGNGATYIPTASTDAVYTALVDTFAQDAFVMFGVCNEPGTITPANLVPIMSHAVSVIRAEEDQLGVPHHLVSVQGNEWTSNISFYDSAPLPFDNVVYEVHGYPPSAKSYTFTHIPVILGEYGSLTDSTSFYADIEAKQIPNLAWDFEPYSDCAPDLLTVTHSATNLVPTAWGMTVQQYLQSH